MACKPTHASLAKLRFRKPTGKAVRTPSPASCFIRKPFGDLMPEDFNERDHRLKDGEEARLLNAAYDEDAQTSIERRLEASRVNATRGLLRLSDTAAPLLNDPVE